jgi:hypothetical protein
MKKNNLVKIIITLAMLLTLGLTVYGNTSGLLG